MHKMLVLYFQPEDPEHFRDYYVNTHLPLAYQMPGLLASRYSFEVEAMGGSERYFAVFEGDFADAGSMRAALSSPEGQRAGADVSNYATGGSVTLHYEVPG